MKLVKLSHFNKSGSFNLHVDPSDVSYVTEVDGGKSQLVLKNGTKFDLDISARSATKVISGDTSAE